MALVSTMTLVAGTLPISAIYLRDARQDAPLLLALYCLVAAGFLAHLSLPSIDWTPDTLSLFGVDQMAFLPACDP